MIIVFLILLLMNPCWAGDWDEQQIQAAIEESRKQYELEQARKPSGVWYRNEDEGEDDPDLREALKRSIEYLGHGYASGTSVASSAWGGARNASRVSQDYTIRNIFDKVRGADTESEYWQDLNASPAVKLAGYMDFLDHRDRSKFEKLFNSPDVSEWASLYGKLGLGKRTANNVFLLLDEVKGAFHYALIRPDSKANYISSINDAMLSLISGKWGFSKCHNAITMVQLKDAALRIGQTTAREDGFTNKVNPKGFAEKIFAALKEKSPSGVSDQDYKRHRLSAFAYMANGYWDGAVAGKKADDLSSLVSAATPKFQAADLKGHPLEDFIKNPAETLKKPLVVRSPETAFTKFISGSTPPKGFQGFLKDFDPDDVDYSDNQENLAALQAGFQGETRQKAEEIVDELMEEGFLKKPKDRSDQLNLKSILIESGQYDPIVDNIYEKAIAQANKTARQGTELKKGSKSRADGGGFIIWISEYFGAIEELSCGTRKAYIVQYDGPIGNREYRQGDEVTGNQFNFANQLVALKTTVDEVKNAALPDVRVGERRVLNLTLHGATVSLFNDRGMVIRTVASTLLREVNEIRQTIAQLSATYQQVIDPNIQTALVGENVIKNKSEPAEGYAVIKGLKRQKARSRAIDYLIQDTRIDSKAKLSALLACWQTFY